MLVSRSRAEVYEDENGWRRGARWLLVDHDEQEIAYAGYCDPGDRSAVEAECRLAMGDDFDLCEREGEGYYVEPVTPTMRHAWRLEARRERYAQRIEEGWRPPRRGPRPPPCDPPLSFGASMSVRDDAGRCRCPECKRFCVEADFSRAPTSVRIPGGIVHFGPACYRCRGVERPW